MMADQQQIENCERILFEQTKQMAAAEKRKEPTRNAFFFFCEDMRSEMANGDCVKELKKLWAELSDAEKDSFEMKAAMENVRAKVDNMTKSYKIKTVIKKPSDGYSFFAAVSREEISREHFDTLTAAELEKKAAESWLEMPVEKKKQFAYQAWDFRTKKGAGWKKHLAKKIALKKKASPPMSPTRRLTRKTSDVPTQEASTATEIAGEVSEPMSPPRRLRRKTSDILTPPKLPVPSAVAVADDDGKCSSPSSEGKVACCTKTSKVSIASQVKGNARTLAVKKAKTLKAKAKAKAKAAAAKANGASLGTTAQNKRKKVIQRKLITFVPGLVADEFAVPQTRAHTKARPKATAKTQPEPTPAPVAMVHARLSAEVMQQAQSMGMKGALLNLAHRRDAAEKCMDGERLLELLQQAGGEVGKAKSVLNNLD
eukprot:gnl/TRDRNA2_/TRDRNA2_176334_c0_seq1.p1 gnl/TRDRNA2_/TRDRNA2_176334_c0~~gnl/TRDRNA2_/TRDRNA2_176334_c0_seq1.p1  ORF type:complete len:427 (-),score=126.68 gnl/TRDRNA2_/TRDRNA2_176334_c0_seq1:194-1474(-)